MKNKFYLFTLAITFLFISPSVFGNTPGSKPELTSEQKVRLEQIVRRVEEIRTIDRSGLTRAERKQLKEELRQLKQEAKVMKGGVYLSVGAIIIIILVLILLL